IRSTGDLDLPEGSEAKVRARELEMARSLVQSLADKFRPDSYTDDYRTALEQLIERKMRRERRNVKRRKPEPKVIDLMEALKASVDEAKRDSGTSKKKKAGSRKAARRSRSAA
ncbi:MAG: Ku protein, partial [Chloroflexi bacterium]|nr:Ku protein [Chloroflexota bacterium]